MENLTPPAEVHQVHHNFKKPVQYPFKIRVFNILTGPVAVGSGGVLNSPIWIYDLNLTKISAANGLASCFLDT